jgi:lysozyme
MRSRLKIAGVGSAAAAISLAGVLAIKQVGGFEGLRLAAYRDVVGVWTACYGETKGIKKSMRFSKATCDNLLIDRLVEHEQGMRTCIGEVNADRIPDKSYVAFVSLTYNIGVGGFCKSSLPRKLRAGDIRAACLTLASFNRAGGRVVKGLVTRRATEMKLCMQGIGLK